MWRIKGSFWHWHKRLIREARKLGLNWKEYGAKGPLGEAYGPLPLSPPPCVLGVASHVRHGVEAAGAAPDAASGPVHHTVVHILLGQRVVVPVVSTQEYLDRCSMF